MPKPIKYLRFREVVKDLINEHYGAEVSKSEMKVIESKLIEYAARGKYEIYVPVPYGGEARDFRMPRGDLLSFVGDPSAVVDIGTLDLYDKANDKLIFEYYEFIKPDNPDCEDLKEISKTYRISTNLFLIDEEDIPLLAERTKSVEESIVINCDRKLLIYRGKEVLLEPKQIKLFELLWENRDKTVRRKTICEKLWDGYDKTHDQKYPDPAQVDQHMSKLRNGLDKLGFKREIIETIKKTQINPDGGYIFNNNLASFLK